MRLQRLAMLLAVFCLVVGLEAVMINVFTGDEASAPPAATATPAIDDEAAAPATNTPAALATPAATAPGFTSPPVGGSSGGGSSNNNSGGGNNNNNSSSGNNNGGGNNSSSGSSSPKKPDPTAKPTDPPPPTDPPGTSIGSGSFSSNTGTNLNMSVSWEAREQGGGKCRVYITGTVNSYSLQVASHPISISFGGYSTSTMGKSLNVPSGSMTSSGLFSTYIDVPSGTTGTMTVSWHYNGEYSDVKIDDVTASGSVYTS